ATDTHDLRTVSFDTFTTHHNYLRVTDNSALSTVVKEDVIVDRHFPIGSLRILPEHPAVGDTVTFDASGSTSVDTTITGYVWDIDGITPNGYEVRTTAPVTSRTYDSAQTITVGVRVLDDAGGGHYGEVRQTIT